MTCRSIVSILAFSASLWGCTGEEYFIEVRLADEPWGRIGCDDSRRGIESIQVQVIRWRGWDDWSELESECISAIDDPSITEIGSPDDILAWFDERGYIARAIPTDERAIVRVRGYPLQWCPVDDVEPLFCFMPTAYHEEGEVIIPVLSQEHISSSEPIPVTVTCHAEILPMAPSTCSNSVSVRCGDNVCGINEMPSDCEQDCGVGGIDLCRWYRGCAYFRRP